MKQLELRDAHLAAGARFLVQGEQERVAGYGDVATELAAMKTAAGLLHRSDLITVRISGKHRVRFMNSMVSNEVAKLATGQGNYAMLLTPQGKLVADMYLYVFEEHLLMVQETQVHAAAMAMLERYLIADKVTFEEITDACGWLSVQGPYAGDVVLAAFPGLELPGEPHAHVAFQLNGIDGLLFREDHTGYDGFDLLMPVGMLEAAWHALISAGARPVGQEAFDIVRVESAIPVAGRDMIDSTIPLEAGKGVEERAISFSKGCYVGQEVVCRIKMRGHVNWMLTSFRVDREVAPGSRLFNAEKDVGWVSSVVDSPDLGRIGLGYVHRNARKPGEHLAVGAPGSSIQVEMLELPVVPRGGATVPTPGSSAETGAAT